MNPKIQQSNQPTTDPTIKSTTDPTTNPTINPTTNPTIDSNRKIECKWKDQQFKFFTNQMVNYILFTIIFSYFNKSNITSKINVFHVIIFVKHYPIKNKNELIKDYKKRVDYDINRKINNEWTTLQQDLCVVIFIHLQNN